MIDNNDNYWTAAIDETAGTDSSRGGRADQDTPLSEVFHALTDRLRKEYDIDKGVLVLRNDEGRQLAAVSTWHHGIARDGLRLNLPVDASLFEKVAEQGHIYTEDFCESFSGNFFERKLLLDDDSRSFVLQPLKSDGRVLGLLGYSSRKPMAFVTFEEGALDDICDRLGAIIEKLVYHQ